MFSTNNKVSVRQLNRIMITENIGMVCLFSGYLAGVLGSVSYVWMFVPAMFISMAYMWISLNISKHFGDKAVKNKIYNLIAAIRFMAMAGFGIFVFCRIISVLLLKGTSVSVILMAVSALCIFTAKRDYEARGRMHEILGVFVLIPIAVILVTSSVKIDMDYAMEQISKGLRFPEKHECYLFAVMFFMVTYFEKLIVIKTHYYNTYGNRIKLLKTPLVLWITAIWVFVVCTCIFGEHATLLKLMDISGIPGDFLNRQDAVMAVFLVISLTSYVSGMFYYIRQNMKNIFVRYTKKPHIVTRRIATAVFFAAAITAGFVILSEYNDNNGIQGGKMIGGKEIEQWDFVMSLVFEGNDESRKIIIEVADYENNENEYIEYEGKSLENIEESYVTSGKNELDFSHIKGIILSDMSPENRKMIIEKLEQDARFSGNVPVFISNGIAERLDKAKDFYLGKTIENLAKNVDEYQDSCLYKAGIGIENIEKAEIAIQTYR